MSVDAIEYPLDPAAAGGQRRGDRHLLPALVGGDDQTAAHTVGVQRLCYRHDPAVQGSAENSWHTYALWSGIGTVVIVLVGRFAYGQMLQPSQLIGIGMITAGVALVNGMD